jgi:carbon-monoxide dehydrogenase medium subunit/xanthine dehydrogenase FAD-binding subunit
VSAELLRDVMAVCDGFIKSRSRQDYRKQVTPGFLVRALAKAMKTAGANENACAIAEEVAHG